VNDTADNDALQFARALCNAYALGNDVRRFPTGSLPVFQVDERYVIKLFPLHAKLHFDTEVVALTLIDDSLSIPTPKLVASGTREKWWYIIMTHLRGMSLAAAWPSIDDDARKHLMADLGRALAELHALPHAGQPPFMIDWTPFLQTQSASCCQHQAGKGLSPLWLDQIETFLDRWFPISSRNDAFLHTEVMREHLLVVFENDHWRLSGLMDFEPAMVGAPEYEFASVGLFVTCAESGLLAHLLQSYGIQPDKELPFRLMAYALLHRYSNLKWYLERLPIDNMAPKLESLALRWFAV